MGLGHEFGHLGLVHGPEVWTGVGVEADRVAPEGRTTVPVTLTVDVTVGQGPVSTRIPGRP